MSQPQSELEATIELLDSEGNLIDTIAIPAEEMAMLEAAAKEAGVPTEDFIREVIKEMLRLRDSIEEEDTADVDN